MTREDFIILREEAIKREGILMLVKGSEYHTGEDFLLNFKEDGPAVGVDPIKTLMIYAGKHWRAIQRFAMCGREGVEGIEGRVDDLVNYLHLLLGLVQEKKGEKEDAGHTELHRGVGMVSDRHGGCSGRCNDTTGHEVQGQEGKADDQVEGKDDHACGCCGGVIWGDDGFMGLATAPKGSGGASSRGTSR